MKNSSYLDGAKRPQGSLSGILRELEKASKAITVPPQCRPQMRDKQVGNRVLPLSQLPPLVSKPVKPTVFLGSLQGNKDNITTPVGALKPDNPNRKIIKSATGDTRQEVSRHLSTLDATSEVKQWKPNAKKQRKVQDTYKDGETKTPKSEATPKSSKSHVSEEVKGGESARNANHFKDGLKKASPGRPACQPGKREGSLSQGFVTPVSSLAKEMTEWLNAVKEHLNKIEQAQRAKALNGANKTAKPKPATSNLQGKTRRSVSEEASLNAEAGKILKYVDSAAGNSKAPAAGRKQINLKVGSSGKDMCASSDSSLWRDLEKLNDEINRLGRQKNTERSSLRPARQKPKEKPKDSLLEIRPSYVENIPNPAGKGTSKKAASPFSPRPLEPTVTVPANNRDKLKQPEASACVKSASAGIPSNSGVDACGSQVALRNPPQFPCARGFILLDKTMNSNVESKSPEETDKVQNKGFILLGESSSRGKKSCSTDIGGATDRKSEEKGFILVETTDKGRNEAPGKMAPKTDEKKRGGFALASKENNVILVKTIRDAGEKAPQKSTASSPSKDALFRDTFTVADDGIFGSLTPQGKIESRERLKGKDNLTVASSDQVTTKNISNSSNVGQETSPPTSNNAMVSASAAHEETDYWTNVVHEKLRQIQSEKTPSDYFNMKADHLLTNNTPPGNSSQNSKSFNFKDIKLGRAFEDIVKETQQLIQETEAAMKVVKQHGVFSRTPATKGKSDNKLTDLSAAGSKESVYKDGLSVTLPPNNTVTNRSSITRSPYSRRSQKVPVTDLKPEVKPKISVRHSSPMSFNLERKSTEPRLCVKPEEVSKKRKRLVITADDFNPVFSPLPNRSMLVKQYRTPSVSGDASSASDIGDQEVLAKRARAKTSDPPKPALADTNQPVARHELQESAKQSPKSTMVLNLKSPVNEDEQKAVTSSRTYAVLPSQTFQPFGNRIKTVGKEELNRVSSDTSLSTLKDSSDSSLRGGQSQEVLHEIKEQWSKDFREKYMKMQQTRESNPRLRSNVKSADEMSKRTPAGAQVLKTETSESISKPQPRAMTPPPMKVTTHSQVSPQSEKEDSPAKQSLGVRNLAQPVEVATSDDFRSVSEDTLEMAEAIEFGIRSSSQEFEIDTDTDPFHEWIQSREVNVSEDRKGNSSSISESVSTSRANASTNLRQREERSVSNSPLVVHDTHETYLKIPSRADKKSNKNAIIRRQTDMATMDAGNAASVSANIPAEGQAKPAESHVCKGSSRRPESPVGKSEVENVFELKDKELFTGLDGIVTMTATPVSIPSSPPPASKSALKKKNSPRGSGETKHVWFQTPLTMEEQISMKKINLDLPKPELRRPEMVSRSEPQSQLPPVLPPGDRVFLQDDVESRAQTSSRPVQDQCMAPLDTDPAAGLVNTCSSDSSPSIDMSDESRESNDSSLRAFYESERSRKLAEQKERELQETRMAIMKSYQESLKSYEACLAKYPALERYKERMRKAREAAARAKGDKPNTSSEA